MPRRHLAILMLSFSILLSPFAAATAGDLEKGAKIFKKCAICHTVQPAKHKIGPSLAGVVGRTAGTIEKYRFSKAMKDYGAAGNSWTRETLDAYLTKPRAVVKGTRMSFPGLKKEADRDDVIAYLESLVGG